MASRNLSREEANNSLLGNGTTDLSINDTTETFLVSLAINAALAVVILALFSFLRPRWKRLYAPRLLLLDTARTFPIINLPETIFAWLLPAKMANDDTVFDFAGIDALVYIRFMKLCLKISFIVLPYGVVVLLPLNLHGGMHLDGLDKLTMSNIEESSQKVWAHLIAVWAYSLIICYLLYKEWKVFVVYRQEFLAKGLCNQYAVFVRDLPDKLLDAGSLKTYATSLFPGQVADALIVQDVHEWEKLVKQHDKLVLQLEKAKFRLLKKGKRPKHKPKICREEVDSIEFYKKELKKLQDVLEDEAQNKHTDLRCGFVVFKSLKSASVGAQVLWDSAPPNTRTRAAPDYNDIIWENLGIGLLSRALRTSVVWMIVFFLVFFWTIPTGFVSSLIALDNIRLVFPSLDTFSKEPSMFKSLIKGFLSSVALWLFFLILPYILRFFGKREGTATRTEVDQSVLGRLFTFKAINQFLFLAIVGSALDKIEEMIHAPDKIPVYLAMTLPSQSTFYISFIMLRTFTGYGLEILRWLPLLLTPIRKCLAVTPREERQTWIPPRAFYEELYADHLLVFMIGLSYSILAPLITPFVVLYFGIGYVVWTYQVLCVYIPTYNSGGQLWPVVFSRMIASLIVFHLLMMGIFGLKKVVAVPLLVLPLPVITIAFYLLMLQYYQQPSAFLSRENSSSLPETSSKALQEAAECYRQSFELPPVFSLSIDEGDLEEKLMRLKEETSDVQDGVNENTPLNSMSSESP